MDAIYPHCANVHKETVVACARMPVDWPAAQQVRTFEITTVGLLALSDWLESCAMQHLVMETTDVRWKSAGHVLEGHFK